MINDDGTEIEFYGNNLWNYYDNVVSNNALSFDYYGFDKEKRISAPKFKLSISGKTSNKDSKIVLDSCSLYKFSYQLKSEILKHIKTDLEKFKTDQKWSHGFSFNGYRKNVYVTTMWNDLSNSAVIRFMIGEKERTILESDKIYVPIVEFFSFSEILNQAFNNYVNLCAVSSLESNIVRLQKTTDNLTTVTANAVNSVQETSDIPVLNNIDLDKTLDSLNLSISGNQTPVSKVESVVEKIDDISDDDLKLAQANAGKESVETQESFDKFLQENRDKFELDLPNEKSDDEKDKKLKDELKNDESKFISKLCNNDFSVLEQIVFNTANEDLPFNSFVESIKNLTDIDFSDGISKKDFNSLNYVISNNIKYHINQLLEKKVKLPSSITPIIVKNEKVDNDKIDTMYYLLLFYIYLSKVKVILSEKTNNALDNKEYFSYIIKTISNPLVFSYFPSISEEVIKTETLKRYRILKENSFFDNFIKNIKDKIKTVNSLNIDDNDISDNISKIYSSVLKFKDKLGVESSFNSSIMKVSYKILNEYDLELNTLSKLIHFDSSFVKYGKIDDKIDLKSYDDVPVAILKIYGIKSAKFDNSIIIKYFTDNIKNFGDLEKIKRINKNVYDILDDIDITKYGTNELRALYFWNVDQLPRDITYFKFKNLIDSSTLEKSELMSMILNKTVVIDKDFYNSFLVSASDGTNV